MTLLTKDAVHRVLGPVDDSLVAELIGTGATEEELREARAWVVNDEALLNQMRRHPAGRVGSLVEMLRSLEGPLTQDE